MLATQLEAIYARTFFPASTSRRSARRSTLTVRAPKAYDVVSNMPRRCARAPTARGTRAPLRATPPMPTYLVGVAVGRFDVLAGRAAGVPLRILTAPGKRSRRATRCEARSRCCPTTARYFGVPYALPKLDQLAVPSTRWGAMEDWGLISYAEDTCCSIRSAAARAPRAACTRPWRTRSRTSGSATS